MNLLLTIQILFAAYCSIYVIPYLWRLTVGPFRRFYAERVIVQNHSLTMLEEPVCKDPVRRVATERVNRCSEHERIAQESLWLGALNDVMEDIRICKSDGTCVFLGINFASILPSLIYISVGIGSFLYILSFCGIFMTARAQQGVMLQLPIQHTSGKYIADTAYR